MLASGSVWRSTARRPAWRCHRCTTARSWTPTSHCSTCWAWIADQLIGRRMQDITHPDDWQRTSVMLVRAAAGAIESFALEQRYLRPDGSIVWAQTSVSVLDHEHESVGHRPRAGHHRATASRRAAALGGDARRVDATAEPFAVHRRADRAARRRRPSARSRCCSSTSTTSRSSTTAWVTRPATSCCAA